MTPKAVRHTVDTLLNLPDKFGPETLFNFFALDLKRIEPTNPNTVEFAGDFDRGPFSTLRLLIPAGSRKRATPLVYLRIREGIEITRNDLDNFFDWSEFEIDVNPGAPPRGIISCCTQCNHRTLFLDFDSSNSMLQSVAVHDS